MSVSKHPFRKFSAWYEQAQATKAIPDASAMCLSTATQLGAVSSRMVLLKAVDQTGFIFYTNMNSRKSKDIKENQYAALCFYWPPLGRQVRIEGYAEPITKKEADIYFASRPRASQIGAWASNQSEELETHEMLKAAYESFKAKFEGQDVPRPPHWGGWRVIPTRIEFWEEEPHRLHKREVFIRKADGWESGYLQP